MDNILIIVFSVVFILITLLFFIFKRNSKRITGLEKKSKTDTETHGTLSNRITNLKKEVDDGFKVSMEFSIKRFDKIESIMNNINSYYENEDTLVNNLTTKNKSLDKKVTDVGTELTTIKDLVATIKYNNNDMKQVKNMLVELIKNQEEK